MIYGKGGKADRAINKELSYQIKHQFDLGYNELLDGDRYLFKKQYTLKKLLIKPIIDKRRWLELVTTARDVAINLQEQQQQQQQLSNNNDSIINLIQQQLSKYYLRNN